MSSTFILSGIAGYFCILFLIAWYTSRNAGNAAYFTGNKASPWYAVAFGMISDSLSGVTFISVPGAVGTTGFSYLQVVLGYFVGYFIISEILLPLYYRLNLTSIYSYLLTRFGKNAQRTGSFFFLLSRVLGAAARLYLTASVIQLFVFDAFGIPFGVSVSIIILLILAYTYKGGIKTLVWTDSFQSAFLLLGVLFSIIAIAKNMDLSFPETISAIGTSDMFSIFSWEPLEKSFFPKQFIGGIFICVAMTGLDQNMMQKNLSCRSLSEASINMRWFSLVLVIVNVFFLALGALLHLFARERGIEIPLNPETGKPATDLLFPTLALNHLGTLAGLAFIVGLIAATFSSADSVLTSLTTSFMIDFLNENPEKRPENQISKHRHLIHIGFAAVLLAVILILRAINDQSVIDLVLLVAGYTYGPLLGLFGFGLFSTRKANDRWIPWIAIAAPTITYFISSGSKTFLGGYQFGVELILLNGALTFFGLWLSSRNEGLYRTQSHSEAA